MKNRKKKNSPLSILLALLLLCWAISAVLPVLEILIDIFLIGLVGYVIYCIVKAIGAHTVTDNSTSYSKLKGETLKRQIEILLESTDLVNNSNNLDTVLYRYDLVCSTLDKLTPYTDSELRAAGFTGSLNDTKDFIYKNKISIINQAIERNIQHELDALKTNKGKINKLEVLYSNMKRQEKLEIENILFLNSLYKNILDNLNNNHNSISTFTEAPAVSDAPCSTDSASSYNLNIASKTEALSKQETTIPDKNSEHIVKLSLIENENIQKQLNLNFTEIQELFPLLGIIPSTMMTRFSDGLLPGHVYMLYWLKKYTNKSVPVYFKERYGINFEKEKQFLIDNGYLGTDNKPTTLGNKAIQEHYNVIEEHILDSGHNREIQNAMKRNPSEAPAKDMVDNNLRGTGFEKDGNIIAAINLYEYNVKHHFEGTFPYQRLAIIYRKQKDYINEIRVINSALKIFQPASPDNWFTKRLEKAKELQRKQKN